VFQTDYELCDRRPVLACGSDHSVCVDCFNECRQHPNAKCPTCGDALLDTPIVSIPVEELKLNEKPFARGGFGLVYKARWKRSGEYVVVKAFVVVDDGGKDSVRSEAGLTLFMRHANIVKLFGITSLNPEKLGIVMEFAEHGPLDRWIGKLDLDQMTNIAIGVIDGLMYVHSQNVIHRDIKPNNVLLFGPEDDMIPKIADFGVSKLIQTAAATHTKVGQDLYMAPEVRMFNRYSFPADVFSLAMTMFEMFNEELIRDSPPQVQKFIMQVHGGRVGQLPMCCKVPEYLHSVIRRGWDESPEQRPTLAKYRTTINGDMFTFIPVHAHTICN